MLSDAWLAPLVAAVGTIIWFIRGEGRTNANEKANDQLSKRVDSVELAIKSVESAHGALSLKLVEELGKIRESLARIEERGNHGD